MDATYLSGNLIGRSLDQLCWQLWWGKMLRAISGCDEKHMAGHRQLSPFKHHSFCCKDVLHMQGVDTNSSQCPWKRQIHGAAKQKSHSMFYYSHSICGAKRLKWTQCNNYSKLKPSPWWASLPEVRQLWLRVNAAVDTSWPNIIYSCCCCCCYHLQPDQDSACLTVQWGSSQVIVHFWPAAETWKKPKKRTDTATQISL